jgi:predicted DsbA family dithiol-disulfide isomerase
VSYELHPETPREGVLLSERFKGMDMAGFYEQLRARGREAGVVFGGRALLSNSRLALAASEFARDQGKFESFHENIFRAYFTYGRDIGSGEIIAAIAGESGLDAAEMMKAVEDGRYAPRLADVRKEGRLIDLTGVPTFMIETKYKIVGAQPIGVFREFLNKIGAARLPDLE